MNNELAHEGFHYKELKDVSQVVDLTFNGLKDSRVSLKVVTVVV